MRVYADFRVCARACMHSAFALGSYDRDGSLPTVVIQPPRCLLSRVVPYGRTHQCSIWHMRSEETNRFSSGGDKREIVLSLRASQFTLIVSRLAFSALMLRANFSLFLPPPPPPFPSRNENVNGIERCKSVGFKRVATPCCTSHKFCRRAQLKDQKMSPKKQNNTETKINRKETQINRNETLNYQIGESGGFKYDSPYENLCIKADTYAPSVTFNLKCSFSKQTRRLTLNNIKGAVATERNPIHINSFTLQCIKEKQFCDNDMQKSGIAIENEIKTLSSGIDSTEQCLKCICGRHTDVHIRMNNAKSVFLISCRSSNEWNRKDASVMVTESAVQAAPMPRSDPGAPSDSGLTCLQADAKCDSDIMVCNAVV
ncbi:hypothetical protein F2P81_001584 [Scophthalmus maximus]|uniref:Uncharacterized protein n=1 Tax=Scophthalmus maximus TaxID=52904 RepID=A0A6A4TIG2_SCOMX|nr:hypothetical protein F2P81_001584 [Scophthalmus maximus]